MRIEFNGAVALVTGAASGIGRAALLALQEAGARVAGADRDTGGLAALAGDPGALAVEMDVRNDAAVAAGIERVEAELGPIDVLVTAAGVLQRPLKPESVPMAEWDRVMATNLRGTFRCCATAGARMAARGRGAIVAVSSVMGAAPGPLHAYGPAKAGIDNLVRSLAVEWASYGVRVNAVAPGFVETPALRQAAAFRFVDTGKLAEAQPRGRLVSEVEVAQAILFLACDLAGGITGVSLPVDGGFLASAGWRGFESGNR